MDTLNPVLLMLHFLGLAMGLSASFSGMVVQGLIAKAAPPEKPVLARVPAGMIRIGEIGLTLLWTTGLTLVFTKWGGFSVLPWHFHVKLTAVVILTAAVAYIQVQMRKGRDGDAAALAKIPAAGRVALLAALTAIVFAVLTFD